MCVAGKVQYTGSTSAPYLTNNKVYDIVAVTPQGGSGAGAYVAFVADNGVLYSGDTSTGVFTVTSLFAPTEVI